jgi:hypothetical protein
VVFVLLVVYNQRHEIKNRRLVSQLTQAERRADLSSRQAEKTRLTLDSLTVTVIEQRRRIQLQDSVIVSLRSLLQEIKNSQLNERQALRRMDTAHSSEIIEFFNAYPLQ